MSDLAWLDEIEARAEAATPGPWGLKKYGGIGAGAFYINPVLINVEGWEDCTGADLAFLAHAREDVPRLCQAVRELAEALGLAVRMLDSEDVPGMADREVEAQWDALRDLVRDALERWRRGGV